MKKFSYWNIHKMCFALVCTCFLTACTVDTYTREAFADLCEKPEHRFVVQTGEGEETFYLYTYLYNHAFTFMTPSDGGRIGRSYNFSTTRSTTDDKKPVDFYITLVAFNHNRVMPNNPSSSAKSAIPVFYDSRRAFIQFENGEKVYAHPYLLLSDSTHDYPAGGLENYRPSPFDINSFDVHRHVAQTPLVRDRGSISVIFPISAYGVEFKATSRWTIHLGELSIDGVKVQIPDLTLCQQPAKKRNLLMPVRLI